MGTTVREKAQAIANFLTEHKCIDTVVLDVREHCNWTDFMIVATVSSLGHLKGIMSQIDEVLEKENLQVRNRRKNPDVGGWELIDCQQIVIHLMSAELRAFYSLEKLWSVPPLGEFQDGLIKKL